MEEEEEELDETPKLEPIIELTEPKEEDASSGDELEKTTSVLVQTDDLQPKTESVEDIPIETVSAETEMIYMEQEGEFSFQDLDYLWESRVPMTPPPTPKESRYFDVEELLRGEFEESEEEMYIPYASPIQGKQVSIALDKPSLIPRCSDIEKEKEEQEKLNKKRAVFIDETLTEKPGLKVAILDPEAEKRRAECISYSGVERFAAHFVDTIIDKSIDNIMTSNSYLYSDIEVTTVDEGSAFTMPPGIEYLEPYPTYVKWPSIREFTKELGRCAIDDYVQGWEYAEEWLYCIDFLMEQSDDCSDYYLYDVKWSIPTKQYPIPQATASVYFTIQVCRVKPAHCTVDVTYQFEASRLVHIPGKIAFQEKWLFDIVDAKIELFRQIDF